MKKGIYIKDWLELKPYEQQTVTDSYYLKLCNDVKKIIIANKQSLDLQLYLKDKEINLLCCFLISYFEDLISETNIWNAFVRTHQSLYGKQLPFYNLDAYYEEEINSQDISFLIWYFLNTVQEENNILPFHDGITETAETIWEVLDKEWEFAPENEHLKQFYQIDPKQDDFYIARRLIETVFFSTYLFYPEIFLNLQEQEIDIIDNSKNDDAAVAAVTLNRERILHQVHTSLLSLKAKVWTFEILGANHALRKDILAISNKIDGYFLYKGQDENNIFITHIASNKEFNLTKKSFDHTAHTLEELDTILFMGIIKWKEEWWFSGISTQQPFDPDLIRDEKNSLESSMATNFLDHQELNAKERLKKQQAAFIEFNHGAQIAFLPSDQIDKFCKSYIEFFNTTLNLPEEQIKAAAQSAREDGFLDFENSYVDFSEIADTGLVFFNPNSGVEIALGINSAFPMPSNPYFEEEDSEEHVERLLLDDSLSTELVMYCLANCKTKLSFFKKGIGKKYLNDIDFLLRFWKKGNYHTKPAM